MRVVLDEIEANPAAIPSRNIQRFLDGRLAGERSAFLSKQGTGTLSVDTLKVRSEAESTPETRRANSLGLVE